MKTSRLFSSIALSMALVGCGTSIHAEGLLHNDDYCDQSPSGCDSFDGCATCQPTNRPPFTPAMFGDAGLLNPRAFVVSGGGQMLSQNHFYKVAENNSPLPQDRIGFNFNGLQDVFAGQDNAAVFQDLYEYRFFAEKAVLDGRLSFDLMIPFYTSTQREYDSALDFVLERPRRDEIFGDLAFGFKALVHQSCRSAISVGLRLEAPTADEIAAPQGVSSFYEGYDDNVWHFTPYLAGLWTPTERVFAQSFLSYRLNSGSLLSNSPPAGNLLREQDYLMADLSVGYWLYRDTSSSHLTGLAPMLELHYTGATTREQLSTGADTVTNSIYGETDQLNLTAGVRAMFGERVSSGLAVAVPLRSTPTTLGSATIETDQSYDWAFMAQLSYYYGR